MKKNIVCKFFAFLLVLTCIFATACTATPKDPQSPDESTDGEVDATVGSDQTTGEDETTGSGNETTNDNETTGGEENPGLVGKAAAVIGKLFETRPDMISFLPDAFAYEARLYSGSEIDFNSGFVNLSTVSQKGVGKQMEMVYSTLQYLQIGVDVINEAYSYAAVIEEAYQLFINENPDNYASYEKTTEHFRFKIALTDTRADLLVSLATASLELSYDDATGVRYGRVQLSDGNVVKYELAEDRIDVALNILNVALWRVSFKENANGTVSGTLTEFFGIAGKYIKSVAQIEVDEDYTYIISDKRETDDLKIEGFVEVYDNKTARYLGGRVKETVKNTEYDTFWFPLYDISGIDTIRKVDKESAEGADINTNADDIYINGSTEHIHTKLVGSIGSKMFSRRFDIEFSKTYFIIPNGEGHQSVCYEMPMMFVQAEYLDSFEEDFATANKTSGIGGSIQSRVTDATLAAITEGYEAYVESFKALKSSISVENILAYIGTENAFFTKS